MPRELQTLAGTSMSLAATDQVARTSLWAAVFEPDLASVTLLDPTTNWRDGPSFTGDVQVTGILQTAAMFHPRLPTLIGRRAEPWSWTSELGRNFMPGVVRPRIEATT